MIQPERLAQTFMELVKIDSVSREEGNFAEHLQMIFQPMGGEIRFDEAGKATGGDTGNMLVRFKGNRDVPSMLLCGHMDTVEPGRGIRPIFKEGIFSSSGDTILGADDKSAVAILIEIIRVIRERGLDHGPLEILLTVSEEVGLDGAKNMDFSMIESRLGYVLDATDTQGIVIKAPEANRLEFVIHGKDAHAGAAPEKGINAIQIAAKAISGLTLGRIDRETTCNIGLIDGGLATNIVPSRVVVKGEARSHDPEKLDRVTREIVTGFEKAVADTAHAGLDEDLPRLESRVETDFPRTDIPENHPVVQLAVRAAKNLGRKMEIKVSGGAADANIFFQKGIYTGVIGTGMRDVHTVRETVHLKDMVAAAELLMEIIRLHGEKVALSSQDRASSRSGVTMPRQAE